MIEGGGLEIEVVEDVAVDWEAESADAWWWNATRDTSRMLTTLLETPMPAEVDALRGRAQELLQEFAAADGSLSVPGIARAASLCPPEADASRYRIVWPSALATSSTAVRAVAFSRSRIGLDSTTSNDPTMFDSAMSSQARCASR